MRAITLAPVSNKADWIEAYSFIDDETDEPIDVSSATEITLSIRDIPGKKNLITITLNDGISHIETGVIEWHLTANQMRTLCPKTYEVGMTIVMDDQTAQLFVGHLPVIDGIVP